MMQVLGCGGDATIDVSADGNGADAVVLIHGFPLSHVFWDAQARALAPAHRTVRLDLRGMGSSSVPPGPYLMETLAADVAAVLDALGIERAALVGHSLGGYVALAFARMFAERLNRLALVGSRLTADTPEQAAARNELADRIERDGSMEPVVEAYVPRFFAPQTRAERPELYDYARGIAARSDPRGAAAMLRGMAMRDAADDIAPDLDIPMVLIAGRADAIISIDEARSAASAFPRGKLAICERSGHCPMLEEPERVSSELQAWLSE